MSRTVVIAGGGPTGLMLACELALAGVPAVVLERRDKALEVSQGMAIHGATLEVFKQRGLADRIRPEDMFPWPRTPFALLWLDMEKAKERDFTYAYPQWRTERLLRDRAVELGADVRPGHELTGFAQDADGVTVDVRSDKGDYRLSGAYLVGCDGADSLVRERAGIGFPQNGQDYYGVLGDMEMGEGSDVVFDAGLHPAGMFGAIPLSADVVRLMTIEFDTQRPAAEVPVTAEELGGRIERITGKAPNLGRMRWLSRFGSPTRLAGSYRSGRVFLAGDAAHSYFISGTQGINTGIHDAVNLGWKLAATLDGHAPEGLLDTYDAERRPVGERMCWHARVTMAMLHPVERIGPLRELITRLMEFEDVNRQILEMPTLVRYDLSAPDAAEGAPVHPLLGTAVPDAPLVSVYGTTSVAEALRGGHGLLLDLSGGTADVAALAAGWAGRVDVVSAKPAAELAAATVLVRPDGHIAYADPDPAGAEGLRAALTRWFGAPAAAAGTAS